MEPIGQMSNNEIQGKPEIAVDPHSIVLATTTFYPQWYPGIRISDDNGVDKVRGDLALKMIKEAEFKGFQVVVVDGANNQEFKNELSALGVVPLSELERGMSASRRQAFKEASQRDGAKVICWAEPEKVSVARDCLPEAILPILKGEADIVVPKRDETLFKEYYPDYQVEYERKSNKLANSLLRSNGLLAATSEDLDLWFGPKFFRNDPEILELFLQRYEMPKRPGMKLDQITDPSLWPNAVFFPIIAALHKKLKVVSVDVLYVHPSEQTQIEADSDEFRRKRDIQYKNIITSAIHFVRMLKGDSKSRLRQVA